MGSLRVGQHTMTNPIGHIALKLRFDWCGINLSNAIIPRMNLYICELLCLACLPLYLTLYVMFFLTAYFLHNNSMIHEKILLLL